MKIFLITFFLCCHFFANAQVYQGTVWLTSQAAVDSFAATYPGITSIWGDLVIGKADTINLSDITDLSPLTGLEFASHLYISNNANLATLRGLEAMDTLNVVYVFHNPKLVSLEGLHRVRRTDTFVIRQNDSLPNLQGLNSLFYTATIAIERNQNMISLAGLDSLDHDFFGMTIAGNPRLKTLSGMLSLRKSDRIRVFQNDSLLHFGYFPKLEYTVFEVHENNNLVDFSDMADKVPKTSAIVAYDNPRLTSLVPLGNIVKGGVSVWGNPLLTTVKFDSLQIGGVWISGPAIQHIEFQNAHSIPGFHVYDCSSLKSMVNALPAVDSIASAYDVYDNDSLTTLHEDWGPRYIWNFYVRDNPQLRFVTGFEGMEETWIPLPNMSTDYTYGFVLKSPSLQVVSGFNNLKKSNIRIENNSQGAVAFERLEGFSAPGARFTKVLLYDSQPVHTLSAFKSPMTVTDEISIFRVIDTLSCFNQMEKAGDGILGTGELNISKKAGCYLDPTSFGKLRNLYKMGLSNARYNGPMIPFPALEKVEQSGVGTDNNNDQLSLEGIYPKLKSVGAFGIAHCSRIKSLDGIEGITEFKKLPGNLIGAHLGLSDNDSLSDCSALCYLLEHATFSPANFPKVIDNPMFPCTDLATVQGWCDTLTVSATAEPLSVSLPQMVVFPNPVQRGMLNITAGDTQVSGLFDISIGDAAGRVALSGKTTFSQGLASINVSALSPGWYQITLRKRGEAARTISFIREDG